MQVQGQGNVVGAVVWIELMQNQSRLLAAYESGRSSSRSAGTSEVLYTNSAEGEHFKLFSQLWLLLKPEQIFQRYINLEKSTQAGYYSS